VQAGSVDGGGPGRGPQFGRERCCIGLVPRGQRYVFTAAGQVPRSEAPVLPAPMIAVVIGCPSFIIGWVPAADAGQLAASFADAAT